MGYWNEDEITDAERAYRYYSRVCPWAAQEMMYCNGYTDEDGNPIPDNEDEQI